ncbi:MAG: MMPL family transporter, partial [Gammaproteobacteria bacterium]|nr:MMPL family transporter [Gammaproteobacteria bacterium]
MVLVIGAMVLLNAAFTLPGLAGLVLTVGMSVDANVLIFERIREELTRGAGLRMAIRNGFGRATTTIVDANITTLITGIVLYVIGTDQIKGFAVTLILGILCSMYTAIFCSRVIFDIAERRRWISKLSMSHIIGETHIDFIGKRYVSWVFSALLIGAGLVATFQRGSGILDIDFTGGTSVTMVLKDENKMNVGEVRAELVDTELADKNLLVVERGDSKTRFTINSSMGSVTEVEKILQETFAGRLKTYTVELGELSEADVAGTPGSQATLSINAGPGQEESGVSYDSLLTRVSDALTAAGHAGVEPIMSAVGYSTGSSAQFKEWTIKLGLDAEAVRSVLDKLVSNMTSQPMFPLANKIGGKVAG